MKKALIIVESPAKIKTIQKYLGQDYVIRASVGHIADLSTDGKYGLGVDLDQEYKPKYVILSDKKDKLQSILDAATEVAEIYLATDEDREGEAIAWHLYERLKKFNKPIRRVFFKEITKSGIEKGMAEAGDLNKDIFDAQQARRVLDRIVGFLVSPFVIKFLGPNLSAGRVQSVALKMVVDREKDVLKFKPEEYWNILANVTKDIPKNKFIVKYPKRINNQEEAFKIKKELESGKLIITDLVEVEKKKNPYPPFITYSLAATAAGRYKFTAARTMKAAQSLYESGLITYMRTDSLRTSNEAIVSCRAWLATNKHDMPDKPNIYPSGKGQDAHEAIRPTDINKLPSEMYSTPDEQRLYKLIWERFVASQMNPALYDTVGVTITSTDKHILKANGRVLKYKGWLEISQDLDKNDDDDTQLPVLKINDNLLFTPPGVKADKKKTQPPPRFSEKTLIKELKNKDIGRPSTYASIMSKITDRNYATRKSDMLIPSDLGISVIDKLGDFFDFMDYSYTAEMENKLDEIAAGNLKYADMLDDFYKPFEKQLKEAYASNQVDYGHRCKSCQSNMYLQHGKFGYYMACVNYPACKTTFSVELLDGKPVLPASQETVHGVHCPKCNDAMRRKGGEFGPFFSCVNYPKCFGSRKIPFGKPCNKCGEDLYATKFDGELKLACMAYPNCRNVEALPEGAKVDWISPDKLDRTKGLSKKMKKILTRRNK